jgi:hypothetical protein
MFLSVFRQTDRVEYDLLQILLAVLCLDKFKLSHRFLSYLQLSLCLFRISQVDCLKSLLKLFLYSVPVIENKE